MDKPLVICLTPVKNEAWILDLFLKCTSVWADYIIIADQNSTDGSCEIALRYPKVIFTENKSDVYSEIDRQQLLLAKAREIKGRKLLITLDADEFFGGDFLETDDWQKMLQATEGDSFAFRWINILPEYRRGWRSYYFIWALLDDGSEHSGTFIHSPRLPVSKPEKTRQLEEIPVLHYQYTDWNRMESKQRFYQCLERIKNPDRDPVELFRMYHHMYALKKQEIEDIDDTLYKGYLKYNIDIRPEKTNKKAYWFDAEVLEIFIKHGAPLFRKDNIWQADWYTIGKELGYGDRFKNIDPRGLIDKLMQKWLRMTQPYHEKRNIRRIDRRLKWIWK